MSLSLRLICRNTFLRGPIRIRPCSATFYTNQLLRQKSDDISLENENVRKYLEALRIEFYQLKSTFNVRDDELRRIRQLSDIVSTYEQRNCLLQNLASLKDMDSEKEEDMIQLVKEERQVYQNMLNNVDRNLMFQLLDLPKGDTYSSLILEISAGVGGQEAMLFAKELFDMYCSYMDYKGWEYEVLLVDKTDIGGVRHATIIVENEEAYDILKQEGGVHRVQRVPATEKSGRIHTSTVSVAVIPRPDDIDIEIKEKDIKLETKRASGAGGQHVNTTDSAVRIVHIPTGIVVECQTERSQTKNREIALKKLQAKLCTQILEEQEAKKLATRKSQVGTSNRNEKIRTYNFPQDRITDHRLKDGTLHNLSGFLEGREALDFLIRELVMEERKTELIETINNTSDA